MEVFAEGREEELVILCNYDGSLDGARRWWVWDGGGVGVGGFEEFDEGLCEGGK